MELVKLSPAIKSYIWGGNYFQKFSKGISFETISELWELSLREDGPTLIDSGVNKGKSLLSVASKDDLGSLVDKYPFFPVLVKLIDANDNLSIQVHPSDEYALKNENSFGKYEVWYILSSEPGSGIYVGLNKDYSKEEISEKLYNNSILSALNFYEVKPGEVYEISPGTIHAIGKGVRILEVQQNSGLTYRLFDYNRLDKNGNPRELHISKALDVLNYSKYVPSKCKDTKYFNFEVKDVDDLTINASEKSFILIMCLTGEGSINELKFKEYDSFFLPAGKEAKIKGKCKFAFISMKRVI